MLRIVMLNPIQFTIVRAVPLFSAGADCATNVASIGESAITANPHISRNEMNKGNDSMTKKKGESKQHKNEIIKAY